MKTVFQILSGIRPEIDYAASSNFVADRLLDSLDMIRLVSELDENFGISIDGEDIASRNFTDLDSIEGLVRKYMTGNIA